MNRLVPFPAPVFALVAAVLLGSLACENSLGPVRNVTVPPDLRYIPPDQIKTAMWVLAAEIRDLERILDTPNEAERVSQQSEVLARLERMRVAAETLDQPGKTSQHPVLNINLPRFIARIRRAEQAAGRNPPNYFPASTLAGSCFVCHGETVAIDWRSRTFDSASLGSAIPPDPLRYRADRD